ncbi:MAG: lytic transglycosylase domain-containing protein [Hyphomicrobiaceae bacterium]
MRKLVFSFYLVFAAVVCSTVVLVATLADGWGPTRTDVVDGAVEETVATSMTASAMMSLNVDVRTTAPEAKVADVRSQTATPNPITSRASTDRPSGLLQGSRGHAARPLTIGSLVAADAEADYRSKLSEAIAPLVALKLSESDTRAIAAVRAALKQKKTELAESKSNTIRHVAGRRLADWLIMRNGTPSPRKIREFLDSYAFWPDRQVLESRMERALWDQSAAVVRAVIAQHGPQSDAGRAALAAAHLADGEISKAKTLARQAWCGGSMPVDLEKPFLKRFGRLLTYADHRCRLDRLLVAKIRWNVQRRRRGATIRRLIPLIAPAERAKAKTRLSMFLRQKAAAGFLAKLPRSQRQNDWGFAFQRVEYLRRRKQHNAAWSLLKSVPIGSQAIMNRDAWWEERHANALNALKARKTRLAYTMVDDIRPESVNPAKDQAFFAGWLALRQLRQPSLALKHFKRMRDLVDGPISSSKALYWLGRTYAALGDDAKAEASYKAGARYRDTFHGLLSRQVLKPKDTSLELPLPKVPTAADIRRFQSNVTVQAARIARALGFPRSYVLRFFRTLARELENEGQVALLGELAHALGDGQLEVRIGKAAIARGFNLYIYSYPVHRLPDFKPLRQLPEPAMVLAITRQESEFNTSIVSGAGASGIMQVMPITARHVCRDYKIKCRIKALKTDPAYNAQIATAYIADRTDDFGGSYILTFTGYNAGPGRTRQWLRTIGDPRKVHIQPLDWIYRIPFKETRNYAQKVLSNVQVYRARLGERHPLRLRQDMNRARSRS